jgi:hypothetical protein
MFKRLKEKLWLAVDVEVAARFNLKPQKRGATWRLYRRNGSQTFATVEYLDTAGGKFTFAAGCSRGNWPTQADTPQPSPGDSTSRGFSLVNSDAYGLRSARVDVELDWQIPSGDLIGRALASSDASPILAQLEVATERNHEVLSYGILDSLGIKIPDDELDVVVRKFTGVLNRVLSESVGPMLQLVSNQK